MKTLIARSAAALAMVSLVGGIAIAKPKAHTAKPAAKPAAASCPVCHMALTSTKSKTQGTAVRLKKGGPVLYCCSHCKMPASVLVKPGK